ncbi:MAG: hypothetical protein EOO41_00355, partial [Methanobacteriota archaeon]
MPVRERQGLSVAAFLHTPNVQNGDPPSPRSNSDDAHGVAVGSHAWLHVEAPGTRGVGGGLRVEVESAKGARHSTTHELRTFAQPGLLPPSSVKLGATRAPAELDELSALHNLVEDVALFGDGFTVAHCALLPAHVAPHLSCWMEYAAHALQAACDTALARGAQVHVQIVADMPSAGGPAHDGSVLVDALASASYPSLAAAWTAPLRVHLTRAAQAAELLRVSMRRVQECGPAPVSPASSRHDDSSDVGAARVPRAVAATLTARRAATRAEQQLHADLPSTRAAAAQRSVVVSRSGCHSGDAQQLCVESHFHVTLMSSASANGSRVTSNRGRATSPATRTGRSERTPSVATSSPSARQHSYMSACSAALADAAPRLLHARQRLEEVLHAAQLPSMLTPHRAAAMRFCAFIPLAAPLASDGSAALRLCAGVSVHDLRATLQLAQVLQRVAPHVYTAAPKHYLLAQLHGARSDELLGLVSGEEGGDGVVLSFADFMARRGAGEALRARLQSAWHEEGSTCRAHLATSGVCVDAEEPAARYAVLSALGGVESRDDAVPHITPRRSISPVKEVRFHASAAAAPMVTAPVSVLSSPHAPVHASTAHASGGSSGYVPAPLEANEAVEAGAPHHTAAPVTTPIVAAVDASTASIVQQPSTVWPPSASGGVLQTKEAQALMARILSPLSTPSQAKRTERSTV